MNKNSGESVHLKMDEEGKINVQRLQTGRPLGTKQGGPDIQKWTVLEENFSVPTFWGEYLDRLVR